MPDGPCNGAVAAEKVTASKGSPSSSCSSGGGGERVGMKKGPWTASEDAILVEYVKRHGEGNWNAVQRNSGLQRCGKSCRLRWANHLRPNLRKGPFSPQEERLILELHAKIGNKWARMAAQLPGRTDNEIKNYWNTRIKRRQRAGLPLYPLDLRRPSPPNPSPNPPLFPSAVHLRPSFSPPLCWTFAAREPLFFDVGLQKLALGEAPLPSNDLVKREVVENGDDDLSALLELIPLSTTREWYNSNGGSGSSSDGGRETSNGQSSGLTEETMVLQALPSTVGDDDGWSLVSHQWPC